MNCLRCHNPMDRPKQAQYCEACAQELRLERHRNWVKGIPNSASRECQKCHQPNDRGPQAKYCSACVAAAYREAKPSKESRRVQSPKTNWKSPEYLGLRPSELDWARLSAFIDGEGCISFSPRDTDTGGTLTLCGRVTVTNTDARLIAWLAETFGMTFYRRARKSDKWKPVYWAQASGYRACWVVLNCSPWLMLKREQAELLLKHQETMGSFERGSGIKTPDNVLEFRASLNTKMHKLNRRGPAADLREKEESGTTGSVVSA